MDAGKAAKLRQIIERAKRDLVSRYSLTHSAMRGEFMSIVYAMQTPNSKAQRVMDRHLSDIGTEAANTERQVANAITEEIHDVAQWVKTPEMFERLFTFQGDIVRQIGRDARAVSSLFRQVQTSLNALPRDKQSSAKTQAIKHLSKPSVFTYKDKVGKIWDTNVYLKAAGSKYYYGLANDLSIGDMHSKGRTSGTLDRPGHQTDGLGINLSDIDVEVRSKYFHPGSQGILT